MCTLDPPSKSTSAADRAWEPGLPARAQHAAPAAVTPASRAGVVPGEVPRVLSSNSRGLTPVLLASMWAKNHPPLAPLLRNDTPRGDPVSHDPRLSSHAPRVGEQSGARPSTVAPGNPVPTPWRASVSPSVRRAQECSPHVCRAPVSSSVKIPDLPCLRVSTCCHRLGLNTQPHVSVLLYGILKALILCDLHLPSPKGDKTALGTFLDSEGLTPSPGQGHTLGLPSPPSPGGPS